VIYSFHFLGAKEFSSKVHLDGGKRGFGFLFNNFTVYSERIWFIPRPVMRYRYRGVMSICCVVCAGKGVTASFE
jgi:hypothetical protein